jgi:hypothetical protein
MSTVCMLDPKPNKTIQSKLSVSVTLKKHKNILQVLCMNKHLLKLHILIGPAQIFHVRRFIKNVQKAMGEYC